MTFQEWLLRAAVYWQHNNHQREGQAHFNALYDHRPDISERIRGGVVDPFYRDERLPDFFKTVELMW